MRESVKILSQDPPSSDNNSNKDVTKLKAMILIYPETQSSPPVPSAEEILSKLCFLLDSIFYYSAGMKRVLMVLRVVEVFLGI